MALTLPELWKKSWGKTYIRTYMGREDHIWTHKISKELDSYHPSWECLQWVWRLPIRCSSSSTATLGIIFPTMGLWKTHSSRAQTLARRMRKCDLTWTLHTSFLKFLYTCDPRNALTIVRWWHTMYVLATAYISSLWVDSNICSYILRRFSLFWLWSNLKWKYFQTCLWKVSQFCISRQRKWNI